MRNRLLKLSALFCVFGLWACLKDQVAGATGVGNPAQGSVAIAMQAISGTGALLKAAAGTVPNPTGPFSVTDSGGTVFLINASYANVGQVRLKLPSGIICGTWVNSNCAEDEVKIVGPFVTDLMTGNWTPDIAPFKVPTGRYQRMVCRLEPQNGSTPSPDPSLVGHAMIIKGTFSYAAKTDRAFSIALDFNEDVAYDYSTGLTVVELGTSYITLFLDVQKWLAQANITRCLDDKSLPLDSLGNLDINASSNCLGLQADLMAAIKGSGSLSNRQKGKGKGGP